MITLLTRENFIGEFKEILSLVKGEINIISPFIGKKTAEMLSEILKDKNEIKCKIITRFYREDFIQGVSNLDGLESLLKTNTQILALNDLHTKLYLLDEAGIMGSANFTHGGFYSNHELSLLFKNEQETMEEFYSYFDELWNLIEDDGDWNITLDKIHKEKILVDSCLLGRKQGSSRPNIIRWGAKLPLIKEQDHIEEYMYNEENVDINTGIWLKFEGTGEDRFPNDSKYYDAKYKRGEPKITSFPRNPRGIKSEDTLYLAVVSYNNQNKPTPVIVGRTKSKGFDPNNKMVSKDKNNVRFPYYLELEETELIDTEIKNGISLLDLYRDVGIKAFPTLRGRIGVNNQDITHLHFRRSHLHITQEAKNYIDKKLNEIFKNYGRKTI
ncbi:phospholipase D family protein [Clostridium estertheticum]|uniref:phospholipase D family protein n=1 Tax=Clostridium estertheticum TaxID=238834 RepID=UPI001C7D6A51|nr:phospholipase D family protein [Clostridium estertheticum]MBX4272098.1 phospholipase D family protein [Clostridium estertheticum]WLC78899.1 phospholipase D family protein [Clostridium estertheticum]